MAEQVAEQVVCDDEVREFTHQEVWEALDEIDSTGELYNPDTENRLLEHLKKESLVEYDEVDCVYFVSDMGWKVYEKGWGGAH